MRLGLRIRFLIPLFLVLVSIFFVGLWTASASQERAKRQVINQVQGITETLTQATYPLTLPILEQMKALSGVDFFSELPDGSTHQTLAMSPMNLPKDDLFDKQSLGPRITVAGHHYFCYRLSLKEPSPNAGQTIYILYPESRLRQTISEAFEPFLWGFGCALFAVLLTFGFSNQLINRLRAIEKRTRAIAQGDFTPMPLPRSHDELRDLTYSVNEMAHQISQLQEAARTSERMRLLGQLAAGLAHQLRNGITGVKLSLQLFLGSPSAVDTEPISVALRQLQMVETNLRRFIDLGRPNPSQFTRVNLAELVQQTVQLLEPRSHHAGISIQLAQLPADSWILGDSAQLSDAILNLVSNAMEAAGPQGIVRVSLNPEEDGTHWLLEVRDNGSGPSATIADRLFEPFVTDKSEGIGLGLAIARQAVEAHRGEISWAREQGETVFRIRLPKTDAPTRP
jgi:signal transduction histidine kinase